MNPFWVIASPIIVALIAVLGGVFGYGRQKAADRDSDLIRVQQEYYRSYLFSIQRVLTSCVRSDHLARRAAIDDFRSFEAALYVAAPIEVAKHLANLHKAFVDYTRCIRCKYEPAQKKKYGENFRPENLERFEQIFLTSYTDIVRSMRRQTLSDDTKVEIKLSLASREAKK